MSGMNNQIPVTGFVLGDPAGIGMEIILKQLLRPRTYSKCRPLLIGNYGLLCAMADHFVPDLFFSRFTADSLPAKDELFAHGIPVVDVGGETENVHIGKVTAESGDIAYQSIIVGYDLLERHVLDGMIMAPLNKEGLAKSNCGFSSEYEIFAGLTGGTEVKSVYNSGDLFCSSVVGHVPFRSIMPLLTVERIVDTAVGLVNVMRLASDVPPRLCVSALNPHCGESGTLGTEEIDIIMPAIAEMKEKGIDASGPFASDTIFPQAMQYGYNGIIHMYHDQGTIAMKTSMFETMAIIYSNVPHVILSTIHGSALDIARLGIANPINLSCVIDVFDGIMRRRGNKK